MALIEENPKDVDAARGQTVLVTGGSGFVGSWAVIALLKRGYRVRTTVRSVEREAGVREMIATEVDPQDRLTFVAADLLQDAGWDRAVEGSDFVLHVASPMPIGEFRGQDVIGPARAGTRRVLEAALRNGVKRVVITSSTATTIPKDPSQIADETVWSDLPDKPAYNYPRSKTLAEQDAWAFIHAAKDRMELATVLPASIQGPVLGRDYSPSIDILGLMLRGKMPVLPRFGFSIVDVRDLVDLHIRAMTEPAAAGERFIAAGEFLWFSDMARILREQLGVAAEKTPRMTIPNFVVRAGALFNPELKQLAPNLGIRSKISAAKAERLLGWRNRPAADSIVDAARSLIAKGLV